LPFAERVVIIIGGGAQLSIGGISDSPNYLAKMDGPSGFGEKGRPAEKIKGSACRTS